MDNELNHYLALLQFNSSDPRLKKRVNRRLREIIYKEFGGTVDVALISIEKSGIDTQEILKAADEVRKKIPEFHKARRERPRKAA
jgi:hypothetical protein